MKKALSVVRISVVLLLCIMTVLTSACAKEEILPEVWQKATYTKDTEVGKGANTVYLMVTAAEKSIKLTVHTDETNLGVALLAEGIVSGDQSEYGLYVKTVNGMTADYDIDGSWWCFNKIVDGKTEMMMVGVDGAEFANGETYELVMTK